MEKREPKTMAELAAEAAARNTQSGSVACPKCGCCDFKVYGKIDYQSQIVRYEQCRHCGKKIITKQPKRQFLRDVEPYKDEDSTGGIVSLSFGRSVA